MQLLTVAWYRVIALFTLYFLVDDTSIMILALPCNRGFTHTYWCMSDTHQRRLYSDGEMRKAIKALFFNFVNTNTFTFVEFNLTIKIGPPSLQNFLFKNFIIRMIKSFFLNTTQCSCRKLTPMIYRTAGHLNYDISFVSLTSRLMAGILDQGCHLTVPRRQGRFLNEKQISLCSLLDL